MTEKERDELMAFLREAMAVREPCDRAAQRLIDQSLAQNPLAVYWLVQQVMGLRMALRSREPAAQPAAQPPARSWGAGVLKTAVAAGLGAGLGAAAGTVLASEVSDWMDGGSEGLGDWT